MPNTYVQLNAMLVFAVKGRANLLTPERRLKLNKYIAGIISNAGQNSIAVNGVADHIHILVNYRPNICLSDLVRIIKSNSSKYMNEHNWFCRPFHWQKGFGAFSYSNSDLDNVINYIENQEEHHKQKSFRQEYLELLEEFRIEYEEIYLFDFE